MAKVKYKELSPEMEKLAAPNTNWSGRTSVGREQEVSEYYHIPIKNLKAYKHQARRVFDKEELEQLAKTIAEHGVRQPLSIMPSTDRDGTYEVVSGERRLRASLIAGLETVPCIIIKDEEQAEELALIENVQRSDLHPVELGDAYSKILENKKYGGMSELAKKIGKPVSSISECARLSNLPPSIRTHLIEKNIRSKTVLRRLNGCDNLGEMEKIVGLAPNSRIPDFKKLIVVSFDSYHFQISAGKVDFLTEEKRELLRKTLREFLDTI